MEVALIGLLGVLLGLLISEYFRRQSRIEIYSKEIFDKRLSIYEGLYRKVLIADDVASETARRDRSQPEEPELTAARQAIIQVIIEYLDGNDLYLDEDLTVHTAIAVLSIQKDIEEAQSQKDREAALNAYYADSKALKRMIREETGLKRLDRLFHSITRAKHSSEHIELWHQTKSRRPSRRSLALDPESEDEP